MARVEDSLGAEARGDVLLRLSGFVLGAVMPFSMFFSSKSAPLMVCIAALLGFVGHWRRGRLGETWTAPAPQFRLFGVLLAVFLGYCAATVARAPYPQVSGFEFGELLTALGAAAIIGAAYRILPPYRFGFGIAIALILAAALVILELKTGMVVRSLLGVRSYSFTLNRTVVVQVVLLWPMWHLIEKRSAWLGWLATALVIASSVLSDSGAAVMGLAAGGAAALLAFLLPRATPRLLAGGTAAFVALCPWLGDLLATVGQTFWKKALTNAHAAERIEIWQAFGAYFWNRPLLGAGFGASPHVPEDPLTGALPAPMREALLNTHPHNAFLQVWVELGAVGALLAAALAWVILSGLARLDVRSRIFAAGLAGTYLSIAAVSHGAWQGWWIATVAAAAALFAVIEGRTTDV